MAIAATVSEHRSSRYITGPPFSKSSALVKKNTFLIKRTKTCVIPDRLVVYHSIMITLVKCKSILSIALRRVIVNIDFNEVVIIELHSCISL